MTKADKMVEQVALAIWRETYRHDTLLEWHELRKGQEHHKRVLAAAKAAVALSYVHPTTVDDTHVTRVMSPEETTSRQ